MSRFVELNKSTYMGLQIMDLLFAISGPLQQPGCKELQGQSEAESVAWL